jgi:uncharacterized membrane protein YedE/YeeE
MDGTWWKQWKGPVAVIIGLLVGTGTYLAGFKVSAGGVCISLKVGPASLQLGSAAVKASGVIAAIGPSILLRADAATVVYFMP